MKSVGLSAVLVDIQMLKDITETIKKGRPVKTTVRLGNEVSSQSGTKRLR